MKCLVVEDNRINLKVFIKNLERIGVEYDTAENGQITIDKLQVEKFDFMLLDLQMPLMDGRDVLRWVRSHSESSINNLVVIVVSAASLENTESEVKDLGANYFLAKPISREKLDLVIEEVKKE
jgi:CheY-like chemotaxis protein